MNTSEVIRNRHSIRKYKKGVQIPRKDIETMLEAAMFAPSACNTRPWEFVVIENEDIRKKIMEISSHTKMLQTAKSCYCCLCQTGSAGRKMRRILSSGLRRCHSKSAFAGCRTGIRNLLVRLLSSYGKSRKVEDLLKVSSLPLAVIAVGEADEEPKTRGFFDKERVTYL